MAHPTNFPNKFLARLPEDCQHALQPHLQPVSLKHGAVLCEAGEKIASAYFPVSGLVSVVAPLLSGENIEAGILGETGVAGGSAVLNGEIAVSRTMIQIPSDGLLISIKQLTELADQLPVLRQNIAGHEQFLYAQAQQSAACNAVHRLEERLCRWLLLIRHITGMENLALTQEFIAQMLAVQRTSVTLVASQLQTAGLIKYRRGHIQLLNLEALEDAACECFRTTRDQHDRLLSRPN